ncbi:MAG: ATP12 family chaperone protein [Bauldia sp.]
MIANGNGNGRGVGSDAIHRAHLSTRQQRPKRFYTIVEVEESDGAFVVTLDGKTLRTPGRTLLALPNRAVAAAVAAEWEAQAAEIDAMTMPVTRLVNSAIDGVGARADAVRAEIVSYSGSDLLSYRATGPDALIARQGALWDPLLAWAREEFGAAFEVGHGVVPIGQAATSLAAIAAALEPVDPLPLAALHVVTTLTGSAVIALAVARGKITAEEAWVAAHVDEDWEIAQWGEDTEATARRAARWKEMEAAALILRLAA